MLALVFLVVRVCRGIAPHLRSGIDLCQILRPFLHEVLLAAIAAEDEEPVRLPIHAVDVFGRLSHAAELVARGDAVPRRARPRPRRPDYQDPNIARFGALDQDRICLLKTKRRTAFPTQNDNGTRSVSWANGKTPKRVPRKSGMCSL